MYATKVVDLLHELKRTTNEQIPAYNHEVVNQALVEANEHFEIMKEVVEELTPEERRTPKVNAGLLIHQKSLLRNKRVLMAFLHERQSRLRHIRWTSGAVLPSTVAGNLSESEEKFFNAYHKLLNEYVSEHPIRATNIYPPPQALYIEVRVTQEIGQIITENGVLDLEKNSTHFMLRSDAEPFLKTGALRII